MIKAITKENLKLIYNKTAKYYDLYHYLGTFGFDEKGRNYLVKKIVKENDYVLDAGGGTGTTAIIAGEKTGKNGKVVILDLSENMLSEAKAKINKLGISNRYKFKLGDIYKIPYGDETFDVVLSTYSTCPLVNPFNAVMEMLRVLKKGGLLGIAYSTDPKNKVSKWISDKIEKIIWKFLKIYLGCRKIDLISDIKKLQVEIIKEKTIGFIPFYFKIIILKK